MTPDDLAAIKARALNAPGGPWVGAWEGQSFVVRTAGGVEVMRQTFAVSFGEDWSSDAFRADCDTDAGAFIAHAREDVPALLAEVAEMQAHIDTMTETWRGAVRVTRERDEARAEVARLRAQDEDTDVWVSEYKARAEKAEAEVARLDAECNARALLRKEEQAEVARLRAQVAAVEALCDEATVPGIFSLIHPSHIRAALAEHTEETR